VDKLRSEITRSRFRQLGQTAMPQRAACDWR
jgi:hypothetical protein